MAEGLQRGAAGATPGIANLLPGACQELYEATLANDVERIAAAQKQVIAAGNMYQRGRSIGQMLSALKTAMNLRGLCGPDMLPPLQRLDDAERESLRREMIRLGIL